MNLGGRDFVCSKNLLHFPEDITREDQFSLSEEMNSRSFPNKVVSVELKKIYLFILDLCPAFPWLKKAVTRAAYRRHKYAAQIKYYLRTKQIVKG